MTHCLYFLAALISALIIIEVQSQPAPAPACNPPDCSNNGACNPSTLTCDCNAPFTGPDCNVRDPCKVLDNQGVFIDKDCGKNGQCLPDSSDPTKSYCKCQNGYHGEVCEAVNYCILDGKENPWPPGEPCKNGGKCVASLIDGHNKAQCICYPPKVGLRCEFDDPCLYNATTPHPCFSHGTCKTKFQKIKQNGINVWTPYKTCKCYLGYDNVTFCEKKDPCVLDDGTGSVCKNGARCEIDRSGLNLTANCTCSKNYDGPYCERVNKCGIPASLCHPASSKKDCNPCLNEGECISKLEPVPPSDVKPDYKDTHYRVHSCNCSQTSYHGEFCEILKTGVIIIPADHKGPVGTAHVDSFEATSGYMHIYYIIALAFGDEGEIVVDTGDGFQFQLSLQAMTPIPEDAEVLSALRDIEDQNGNRGALHYPLRYIYSQGTFILKAHIMNGGIQSDEKVTNVSVVLPDGTTCVPFSKLKNVGHTKNEATEYKRTDKFVIEASLIFDCFEQEWINETEQVFASEEETRKFRFEWRLYKLMHLFPSPSSENYWHIEHLVNTSEKYLAFGPHVLVDGMYWVECRAIVKINETDYGNSEKGFIRINLNPPRIILREGNNRTVDGSSEIILDASQSVDDSNPEHSPYLEYYWKCTPSCGHGPWEGEIIQIPAGTFNYGSLVSIFLRVESPHSKTQVSTTNELHITQGAAISLKCVQNCNWFNPGDDVIVECNYLVGGVQGPVNDIEWNWFPTNEIFPTAVKDEPYRMSIILPREGNVGIRSLECSATPAATQQEIKARLDFKINTPPLGGSCTVTPMTGTYLITNFSIICTPFDDTSLPLEYTFLVEVDGPNSNVLEKLDRRLLLAHDTNPEVREIYLPFGDPSSGATVNVVIQVTDDLGLSTEMKIPVVVNLPPASDYKLLFSELLYSDRSLMKRKFLRGDYQGVLHIQMVSLYGLLDSTIASALTKDEFDQVLTSIQEKILKTPQHSFKANEQLIFATHQMDHIENRLDPKVLLQVSQSMHDAASKLVQFAKDANEVTSAADLETLADAVADSGSRLLKASVSCAASQQQQPQVLMACNQRNVLDFDKSDENNADTYFEAIEDDLTAVQRETIVSTDASADEMVRECSKSGRNAVRAMRGALDGALGHLGSATAFNTETDTIAARAQIMSQVNSDATIALKTSDVSRDTRVNISIPGSTLEIMQDRIDTDISKLELQAITTTENAYVDDTSACPSTVTVHLKVQDSTAHVPVLLKNLEDPIEISLPILRPLTDAELDVGKSIEQQVVILPVDELDDYVDLPTFQMHLPYNSQIIVKIGDVSSATMIFKVTAMRGRRPIFSDFCHNDSAIEVDQTTKTAVFFTDRIGLNEEPEEPFLDYHVAILVFDFHNIHRQENFSVVFTRYTCLYRDEDRKFWSEKGCMVSNDTNDTSLFSSSPLKLARMKCLCNHASIISGVQFVIPHTIDHSNVISTFTIGEIERNPVVLITVCVLLAFYLIALLICRVFDMRDSKEDVGLTIMADLKVKKEGTKFYLITIVTGCNLWAGTTSSVSLVIYGSAGRSKVFTLKDRSNTVFLRGDIDTFLVACDKDLGALEKIRIWTDHTGVDPAWYCRKILIRSVAPDKVWYFYINRWLTVTAEESTVILEVGSTTKEERKQFSVRYRENLLEQIDNVNLWFSIFRYSPASTFTRCQRLSCAFAVLTGYLLIDIWFHGTPTEDEEGLFDFGEFTLDLYAIVKSIEIVFLALPFGMILITLFRNIRLRYTPTLIIWENAIPATLDRKRYSLYIPQKEVDKSKMRGKKVQLPPEGEDNIFQFEQSSADEEYFMNAGRNIDTKLHPDKLDRISKASTTASGFSIPSTDIPQLEGWIEDRVQDDGSSYPSSGVQSGAETDEHTKKKPVRDANPQFVQNMDSQTTPGSGSNNQDTMFRLGRRAMISSVRDSNPDAFIFQGEVDVAQLEDLIDKELEHNRLPHGDKGKKGDEESALQTLPAGIGKKEIVLGQKKEDKPPSIFKRMSEKTPWKKAVTTKYLKEIDQALEQELENKQFMQDQSNWENQIALEMCRLDTQVNKTSHLSWPWWFIFIAWGVCLFTIFICLFFTLLFGIHYGYLRSLMWLETLVYSFIMSAFVIQPINAMIFTCFSTLLGMRQKVKERLQVVIADSGNTAAFLLSRLPYKFSLFSPIRICEPLKGNQIFRLTIEARRRKELRGKLVRLILCVILLIPLIAVSYSGHNHYNYEVTHNIRNIFQLNGMGAEKVRFQSEATVYNYLENVVVHNLHPVRLYNGELIPPNSPALLSDQQTLLVGIGRIRQQRIKPIECLPPLGADNDNIFATQSGTVKCNLDFKKSTQDRENYDPIWEHNDGEGDVPRYPSSLTNDGWEFHGPNSKKTQSLTFRGQQGTYDGGGYILELGRDRRQSLSVIKYMRKTNWLDHRTRGIFVEVTLMNPNINKFVDVVLLIEQGPTGSFSLTSWISPLELIPIEDLKQSDEVIWVSFSIVAVVVILFIWVSIFLHSLLTTPRGRRYAQTAFWLDLIIIVFVFISLCISLVRFVAAKEVADLIEKQKEDEYLSIQNAAYWNDVQRAMFSVTQALVFIKLWKLLMFTDKRFLTFALTLKLTSGYMLAFATILLILLCAFAMCGFFLFGQDLWEFSTLGECLVSLVDQMLGASFFKRLIAINPILGPAFVFLYGYFVIFIGLNFVVALLDLGVHEAKEVVQQRRVWLTYSRYFKETMLKSLPFVSSAKKQELSDLVMGAGDKHMPSTTIHPDRWYGMKMATAVYIRAFLERTKANKMIEMQKYCNMLLTGTGYRLVGKRQKAREKEQEKQRHIEQLRRMTSVYIQEKLGHEMSAKEFKEYANFNKQIVRLRIQKMEKTMEKLIDRMDEFVIRHSAHPSFSSTKQRR